MRRAGLLAVVSLVLVLAVPAAAAPGDLDRTFSGDGWVRSYDITRYSKGFLPKGAEDVAIQPDGKILAVSELQDGNSHWYFGVSDFSTGADWVGALAAQSDGKIVAAGEVYGDQAVARYLPR